MLSGFLGCQNKKARVAQNCEKTKSGKVPQKAVLGGKTGRARRAVPDERDPFWLFYPVKGGQLRPPHGKKENAMNVMYQQGLQDVAAALGAMGVQTDKTLKGTIHGP